MRLNKIMKKILLTFLILFITLNFASAEIAFHIPTKEDILKFIRIDKTKNETKSTSSILKLDNQKFDSQKNDIQEKNQNLKNITNTEEDTGFLKDLILVKVLDKTTDNNNVSTSTDSTNTKATQNKDELATTSNSSSTEQQDSSTSTATSTNTTPTNAIDEDEYKDIKCDTANKLKDKKDKTKKNIKAQTEDKEKIIESLKKVASSTDETSSEIILDKIQQLEEKINEVIKTENLIIDIASTTIPKSCDLSNKKITDRNISKIKSLDTEVVKKSDIVKKLIKIEIKDTLKNIEI